jgi:hypothetical protein
MARGTDGGRTQIIIAAIGLIGVIAAALIANWDKISRRDPPAAAPVVAGQAPPAAVPGAVPVDAAERQAQAQAAVMNANADALQGIADKIGAASENQSGK